MEGVGSDSAGASALKSNGHDNFKKTNKDKKKDKKEDTLKKKDDKNSINDWNSADWPAQ